MHVPALDFTDVSLLLALAAIVFLITLELTAPYYGLSNLPINRKRLRNVTIVTGVLFLITVAIKAISIITGI
jgi:hypothetical protein